MATCLLFCAAAFISLAGVLLDNGQSLVPLLSRLMAVWFLPALMFDLVDFGFQHVLMRRYMDLLTADDHDKTTRFVRRYLWLFLVYPWAKLSWSTDPAEIKEHLKRAMFWLLHIVVCCTSLMFEPLACVAMPVVFALLVGIAVGDADAKSQLQHSASDWSYFPCAVRFRTVSKGSKGWLLAAAFFVWWWFVGFDFLSWSLVCLAFALWTMATNGDVKNKLGAVVELSLSVFVLLAFAKRAGVPLPWSACSGRCTA